MKVIRECALSWNDYPKYFQAANKESTEIYKWHNQTWQGWNKSENINPGTDVVFNLNRTLKFSHYNIVRRFVDDILIWNTASEAVVLMSNEEYNLIHKIIAKHGDFLETSYQESVSFLCRLGIIVDNNDIEHLKFDFIHTQQATKVSGVKNFIILPTTKCNGRCFYCFSHDDLANAMTMDSIIIDNVVNFISNSISDEDEVVFRWFGGEPLLVPDVIDKIIEGVINTKGKDLKYHSNITSNGSMLNADLLDKALENWHLRKFHITIDGYGQEHARRKSYGMDTANGGYVDVLKGISMLLDQGVYTLVRINLDKNNIKDLGRILVDLEQFKNKRNFFVHVTNLQPINICNREDRFFHENELKSFYDDVYSSLFKLGFYDRLEILLPKRLSSLCTASMPDYVIINPAGELFKCDKENHISQNCIGNCSDGIIHNENLLKWIDCKLSEECVRCRFLPVCQGGCKYYRYNSDKCRVSPCLKLKHTIDTNMRLAYDYFC